MPDNKLNISVSSNIKTPGILKIAGEILGAQIEYADEASQGKFSKRLSPRKAYAKHTLIVLAITLLRVIALAFLVFVPLGPGGSFGCAVSLFVMTAAFYGMDSYSKEHPIIEYADCMLYEYGSTSQESLSAMKPTHTVLIIIVLMLYLIFSSEHMWNKVSTHYIFNSAAIAAMLFNIHGYFVYLRAKSKIFTDFEPALKELFYAIRSEAERAQSKMLGLTESHKRRINTILYSLHVSIEYLNSSGDIVATTSDAYTKMYVSSGRYCNIRSMFADSVHICATAQAAKSITPIKFV